MWRIAWTKRALDDLGALDKAVAKRVIAKVVSAQKDPPRFFERLAGSQAWKLRVGDVRVVALLTFETSVVSVQAVDKRSRVYR